MVNLTHGDLPTRVAIELAPHAVVTREAECPYKGSCTVVAVDIVKSVTISWLKTLCLIKDQTQRLV